MDYQQAREALEAIGADPVMRHNRDGSEYLLHRCAHPHHQDDWPSGTTTASQDGGVLLNCFSCAPPAKSAQRGAWVAQVIARLEAREPKDPVNGGRRRHSGGTGTGAIGIKVAHYDYVDADGVTVARKVRFEDDGRKTFLWQRPYGTGWVDGLRGKPLHELPPYGLHTITPDATTVYVVEGEKDADRLHTLGQAAISAGGSHARDLPGDLDALDGHLAVIIADRDRVGVDLARAWMDRLDRLGVPAVLAQPAVATPKADVSDHLDAGFALDDLDFGPVREVAAPEPGDEAPQDAPEPSGPETQVSASTWLPVPLDAILDGQHEPERATCLLRDDGHGLLYRGRVSSIYGESESGKTWIALLAVARDLADGRPCLYIDFESDAGTIVDRLLLLGATRDQIRDGLQYVRPEARPGLADGEAWERLLSMELGTVVIDGVTESLVMWGGTTKDNDEITAWVGAFPKRFAARTGAAVITIDHVTKSADTRGRFAIGGQAKLASLDGAGYLVEPQEELAPGKVGRLHVRVAKDRPGDVRAHCGTWRSTDRTQLACVVTVDSTGPTIVCTVAAPDLSDHKEPFRPTRLMEAISRILEDAGRPLPKRVVEELLRAAGHTAKNDHLRAAFAALEADGYVSIVASGSARPLHLLAAYREIEDGIVAPPQAVRGIA